MPNFEFVNFLRYFSTGVFPSLFSLQFCFPNENNATGSQAFFYIHFFMLLFEYTTLFKGLLIRSTHQYMQIVIEPALLAHFSKSINLKSGQWYSINLLSTNPTKWSNTLKQFVSNLPTNCLSVFDHFVKLALKGLNRVKGLSLKCKKFEKDKKFMVGLELFTYPFSYKKLHL